MVFSDSVFLFLFLPLTLLVYYAVPFRFKNSILFLTGLLFYSWGEPVYVLIMILSTLIDYCAGRVMHRFDDSKAVRRAALLTSVIMNLSLLAVFKYSSFAVNSLNSVAGLSITDPRIPLPIGISFFTFQSMSYTIDLYRRKIEVQKNFIDFAAFVTMFPQIVAGPIVRYDHVAAELKQRTINIDSVEQGISRFICGLCKKVLIANNVGALWDTVKACNFTEIPAAAAWLGICAFTLQIYFDFSGYSDMAIGLGHMLGFNFPENFDHPYMSESVSEFWRRWHITLGEWFKSYVYFPLGGSRKGKARTAFNTFVVWFLTGLWHGAGVNFILWGLYYGVLVTLEKTVFRKVIEKIPTALRRVLTVLSVMLGWVIFEITSVSDELLFVKALLGLTGNEARSMTENMVHSYAFILVIAAFFATDIPVRIWKKYKDPLGRAAYPIQVVTEIAFFILCIAFIADASYNPFLYFNF